MHVRRATWSADEEPEELLASGSVSATWEESTRNGNLTQIGTFVPGRGATLRNERSDATAVFESGGVSTRTVTPVSDDALEPPVDWQLTHDNMSFTVGGVPYVSSGTLQMLGIGTGFAGSGEIGLWSGGRRVGRIYLTAEGHLLSEVNGIVLPFDGWKVPRGAAR
jgi:hypothetical protein